MRKRNLPKTRNSKVSRQRDPIPWTYCLLTTVCGLLLVAGFFYAARSHFSSMDYAMKNAELRKQIEELKSETRRLKLSKEIALSPAEIKKAAEKLGLTIMTARNIQALDVKVVEKSSADSDGNKTDSEKKSSGSDSKTDTKTDKKENKQTPKNPSNKTDKIQKDKSGNKKSDKKETPKVLKKDGVPKTQVAKN